MKKLEDKSIKFIFNEDVNRSLPAGGSRRSRNDGVGSGRTTGGRLSWKRNETVRPTSLWDACLLRFSRLSRPPLGYRTCRSNWKTDLAAEGLRPGFSESEHVSGTNPGSAHSEGRGGGHLGHAPTREDLSGRRDTTEAHTLLARSGENSEGAPHSGLNQQKTSAEDGEGRASLSPHRRSCHICHAPSPRPAPHQGCGSHEEK